MRIEPTTPVNRASRVALDRPATMRDPSRAPIDVIVRDLSITGAMLEAEGGLPTGTLVSLGIAGVGMQFARVVRNASGGMAVEFMLSLDARVVATAGRVETLRSVAIPQLPVPSPAAIQVQPAGRAPASEATARRAIAAMPAAPIALILLLAAAALLYVVL